MGATHGYPPSSRCPLHHIHLFVGSNYPPVSLPVSRNLAPRKRFLVRYRTRCIYTFCEENNPCRPIALGNGGLECQPPSSKIIRERCSNAASQISAHLGFSVQIRQHVSRVNGYDLAAIVSGWLVYPPSRGLSPVRIPGRFW